MHELRGSSWQPRRALAVGPWCNCHRGPPPPAQVPLPAPPITRSSSTQGQDPTEEPLRSSLRKESLALLPGDVGQCSGQALVSVVYCGVLADSPGTRGRWRQKPGERVHCLVVNASD